jgi:hypothetical protein
VTVDELVKGVGIALGAASIEECRETDGNGNWEVAVNELVTAVNAALSGVPAPVEQVAEESLFYVNLVYNDPVVMRFEPATPLAGAGSRPEDRSITYCALYDNGFTDPAEVKRRSTSPLPPINLPIGGPCALPTHCAEGNVGAACVGSNQAARDASCDSAPDAGDGMCDACPLRGGVTTEDEMFALLGGYYVRE